MRASKIVTPSVGLGEPAAEKRPAWPLHWPLGFAPLRHALLQGAAEGHMIVTLGLRGCHDGMDSSACRLQTFIAGDWRVPSWLGGLAAWRKTSSYSQMARGKRAG